MINRITNTPIWPKTYQFRGFNDRNKQNKNCVVMPNGDLWAVVQVWSSSYCAIMKSTDNGFSWTEIAYTDAASYPAETSNNVAGAMLNLLFRTDLEVMYVYSRKYWAANDIDIIVSAATYPDFEDPTETEIVTDIYQGVYNVTNNMNDNYIAYVDDDAANKISIVRHTGASPSSASTLATTPVFNTFDMTCDEDGNVYFVFTHQTGGKNILKYAKWTTAGWGTPVTIEDYGDTDHSTSDPSISIDGYGNIGVFWSKDSGSDYEIKYALSLDDGATWSVETLTRTDGHSAFIDQTTDSTYGFVSSLGGLTGGFIFTYAETINSLGKTFVRVLTTEDGVTYTLGDEKQIATASQYDGKIIAGAHFFFPYPHSRLLDLADPGLIRVGFRVGDATGSGTFAYTQTPVAFCQELLYESAYPSSLTSDTTTYTMETANSDGFLVTMELLAGPESNIDYYTYGLIGDYTTRYLDSFERIGTSMRILSYEPLSTSQMSERSAFGSPTEHSASVILAPQTYNQPTPQLAVANVSAWMEQDIRKIYFPPDFHLARTYLVNEGGFLKRTVWTVAFDGNEYEISQVVPYFINNEICYYGANAYVIGPSRNPFSRTILPSET